MRRKVKGRPLGDRPFAFMGISHIRAEISAKVDRKRSSTRTLGSAVMQYRLDVGPQVVEAEGLEQIAIAPS